MGMRTEELASKIIMTKAKTLQQMPFKFKVI